MDNKTLLTNILTKQDYNIKLQIPENYNLSDHVVVYSSGNLWRIVLLDIMTSYPLLYDTYTNNEQSYLITLVVCPKSLRAIVFKGTFTIKNYEDNKMFLTDSNDNILPIDLAVKINKQNITLPNRRSEVKIMTLKNAIITVPDATFIVTDKPFVKQNVYYSDMLDFNSSIIPENLIHPKTLIYVIQYKSHKSDDDKYSIVIGKNFSKDAVTGYDFKNDGYISYFTEFQNKIINREGYVFSCLWYIAKADYKNSRIIYIY